MADLFRRREDKDGIGGMKCQYCNWTKLIQDIVVGDVLVKY
jgi:hypothetical protein